MSEPAPLRADGSAEDTPCAEIVASFNFSLAVGSLTDRSESPSVAVDKLTEGSESLSLAVDKLTEQSESMSRVIDQPTDRSESLSLVVDKLTEGSESLSLAVDKLTERPEPLSLATHRPVDAAGSMSVRGGKRADVIDRSCVAADEITGALGALALAMDREARRPRSRNDITHELDTVVASRRPARDGDDTGYGATTLNESVSWRVSGGVRFGVNVPLGAALSWYPRVTLGLDWTRTDVNTAAGVGIGQPTLSTTTTWSHFVPWMNLYLPLLVHPVRHWVMGIVPRIEHEFGGMQGGPYDGSETTLVSVEYTVGGWWGGPADDGDAPAPGGSARGFGEHGQVIVTNATTASITSSTYSKSNASSFSVGLSPSLDYVVAGPLSLGGGFAVGYANGTTLDTSGVPTAYSDSSFGVAPRVGLLLPIAGGVWLWPTFELGYGVVNQSATSGSATNAHNRTRSWPSLPTCVRQPPAPSLV